MKTGQDEGQRSTRRLLQRRVMSHGGLTDAATGHASADAFAVLVI